jgi:hypothetical protein
LSVDVSTHAPEQVAKPALHCTPHPLFWQTATPFAGVAHFVVQAPQVAGDDSRSTHWLPHWLNGAVHVKPHTPPLQVATPPAGGVQTFPH